MNWEALAGRLIMLASAVFMVWLLVSIVAYVAGKVV